MSTANTVYDDEDDTLVVSLNHPKRFAAEHRKQKQRHFEKEQGKADALQWMEAHHPSEIRDLAEAARCFSARSPWNAVSHLDSQLASELKSWGRTYTEAFLNTIYDRWRLMEPAWTHVLYRAGVSDGSRWAETIAAREQIERLRSLLRECPGELDRDLRCRTYTATPAMNLVAWVLSKTRPNFLQHASASWQPNIDAASEAFRTFWTPFVDEPIDELLGRIMSVDEKRLCKLQEPDYVLGFVDGAVGISQHLLSAHPL